MILKQIHTENSDKLILFFNGWGMDDCVLDSVNHSGYDVCMLYQYHQGEPFDVSILDNYKEVFVIAWSMGVYFACKTLKQYQKSLKLTVAINGTPCAIDDKYGISKSIFEGTIQHLDELNFKKFKRRMFDNKFDFERFNNLESSRTLQECLEELKFINDEYQPEPLDFKFDKIFVAQNDRIIPAQNQSAYWANHPCVKAKDASHFPFYNINNWSEVLNG